MLEVPNTILNRSVEKHRCDLELFCDWVEASALFTQERVSQRDVIDLLIEGEYYAEQDFAQEFLDQVWRRLIHRARVTSGNYPFVISSQNISIPSGKTWKDYPAYAFCLTLSLAKLYSSWKSAFGSDYTEQGLLFEKLSFNCLSQQYPEWNISHTGWSREHSVQIDSVATRVADLLGERHGDIENYTTRQGKEAGLDLLIYRKYRDGRAAYPTFFIQCASGREWKKKIHTPDLGLWEQLIRFRAPNMAQQGFTTPYTLDDKTFNQNVCAAKGGMLLLDRNRLLEFPQNTQADWIESDLAQELITWTESRVTTLPKIEYI